MTAIFTRFPTALIALLATTGLFVALENAHAQGTVESDRAVLVALYNATDGPNWDHQIGWLTSHPLYEWANVVTDSDGRVTWFALGNNNLTGELPPELGNLSKLQLLRLHDNNLTGEIPSQLGNLTELVDLSLGDNPGHPGNNEFTGPIPAWLDNLTNLDSLGLQGNALTGGIPSGLGNLSKLVFLTLNDNALSGSIPASLGNLDSLRWLHLNGNDLTGPIPSRLGGLSSLVQLNLGENMLSGPIPPELGSLENLEILNLWSAGDLGGQIPPELGDLASLQQLYLYDNGLTGEIPPKLGDLTSLLYLYLNGNELTGNIPTELEDITSLLYLYLNDNALTGSIPSELGSLTSLSHLALWGNPDLERTVPTAVGVAADRAALAALYWATGGASWTNAWANPYAFYDPLSNWSGVTTGTSGRVTHVRLGNRGLIGPVPAALEVLTDLEELSLNDNASLYGTLPVRLQELASLANLDVRNTSVCTPAEAAFQTWLATITFQGTQCPAASFAEPTYSAAEGGPAVTVTIRLSAAPGRELTILLTATPAGGATEDDYTVTPASATFQSTGTEATVEITAVDDSVYEVGEEVVLGFQRPLSGITEQSPATTTVTLIDNDSPPPPPPPPRPRPPPPPESNWPTADAGPDQIGVWEGALVMLDGSGSSDPDDDALRYRWNQYSGEPVVLSSRDVVNPTFTAPQGLTADAVLSFRLLVTDPSGRFDSDTVTVTVDPEAEPPPPEDRIYYFPHLAVGAGWQTTITYINYSPQEVSCQTDFLSDQGTPLMVSFEGLGTVPSRTDVLLPGGSVHQETNVELGAPAALGWARATCSGPLKASLLFRLYNSEGTPTAEAGVNATRVPATRFVTFGEQGEGKQGTGVAYANPSSTEALITFTTRDETGQTLASVNQELPVGGHGAQNMAPLFGLPSFTGSLEITSTEPIVSLSLNNEAAPVFSSLPPGEPDAAAQGTTTYYFPHLAVGEGWQTTITYINYSPQEVSCQTEFLSDHGSPLLVSFAGRGMDISRPDVLPPGGSVHQETNVELSAPAALGWARATCSGPVKASLLFRRYDSEGVPTGEAGVNAATVPATRFVTFAEQGEGKPGTGVAYANPSDTTTAFVTFTARNADGRMLASVDETLLPNGHDAHNVKALFGLSSFTGSLEVTSKAPIVSLSLNVEADPVFSSLPPGELDAADIPGEMLAPANEAVFNDLFVGKRAATNYPTVYYVDFVSPGRFRETESANETSGLL